MHIYIFTYMYICMYIYIYTNVCLHEVSKRAKLHTSCIHNSEKCETPNELSPVISRHKSEAHKYVSSSCIFMEVKVNPGKLLLQQHICHITFSETFLLLSILPK